MDKFENKKKSCDTFFVTKEKNKKKNKQDERRWVKAKGLSGWKKNDNAGQ